MDSYLVIKILKRFIESIDNKIKSISLASHMKKKLKVLFLSVEVAPFAKVGGLGDVAGALPPALFALGVDIRICLPLHSFIDQKKYGLKKINSFQSLIANKKTITNVYETKLPGSDVVVYFLENFYLKSQHVYNSSKTRVSDYERFAIFSKLALEALAPLDFLPEVIHFNDWHLGLLPLLIKNSTDKKIKKIKTILTIHNLASQGICSAKVLDLIGINKFPAKRIKAGNINFLAEGILGANKITTVSPTYAEEILTAEQGFGLEKLLLSRRKDLHGILNGIDTIFFDPAADKFIFEKYDRASLDAKKENRRILIKKLGWTANSLPLAGVVTRFVWQKGMDLFNEDFFKLPCRFVFLGAGDPQFEKQLQQLARQRKDKFKVLIKFDEKLAHQIYASSDLFLIPSRFEPCGLTQMIAMRYGTVPVVRRTGGLKDTVDNKVGFSFDQMTPQAFYRIAEKALSVYRGQPKLWRAKQLAGMERDFSWWNSARKYLKVYRGSGD